MGIESHWYTEARVLINEYLELRDEVERLSKYKGQSQGIGFLLDRKAKLIPKIGEQLRGERRVIDWYGSPYGERNHKDEYFYDNNVLDTALKSTQREIGKIPTAGGPNPEEENIFIQWRRINEENLLFITEELQRRGVNVESTESLDPPPDALEVALNHIDKTIETIVKLEQEMEQKLEQFPAQSETIRRTYGRVISKLKEEL